MTFSKRLPLESFQVIRSICRRPTLNHSAKESLSPKSMSSESVPSPFWNSDAVHQWSSERQSHSPRMKESNSDLRAAPSQSMSWFVMWNTTYQDVVILLSKGKESRQTEKQWAGICILSEAAGVQSSNLMSVGSSSYLRETLRALRSGVFGFLLLDLEAEMTSERKSLRNLIPASLCCKLYMSKSIQ